VESLARSKLGREEELYRVPEMEVLISIRLSFLNSENETVV
jgi:hypothetical protein